ncbi:hypothetical protein K439DRAFT_1618810 [Ramaria rubella]|nr:hypothetical protein K439DRAFT_1618810 [Ramaria rubella]
MPLPDNICYANLPSSLKAPGLLSYRPHRNIAARKKLHEEHSDTESDSDGELFPEKASHKRKNKHIVGSNRLTKVARVDIENGGTAGISGKNTVNMRGQHEESAYGTSHAQTALQKPGHTFKRGCERVQMLNLVLAFNLVKAPVTSLTPPQKELKKELQVTGLKTKHRKGSVCEPVLLKPPQPGALPRLNKDGLVYMALNFEECVDHALNKAAIAEAAVLAKDEITTSPSDIMDELCEDISISIKLLMDLGKVTWYGWADRYKGQIDKESLFRAHYGFNPKELIYPEWMLDEDSGPESGLELSDSDEEEEAMEDWTRRMTKYLNIRGDSAGLEMEFLEVVDPGWQSDYMSVGMIFHELSRINRLANKDSGVARRAKARKYIRVQNLGHMCDRPTPVSWWTDMEKEGKYVEEREGWKGGWKHPSDFGPVPLPFEPFIDLPPVDSEILQVFIEEEEDTNADNKGYEVDNEL